VAVAEARTVKAGRRPPVGEALRVRSVRVRIMVVKPRQGASGRVDAGLLALDALRWSSPVPRGVGVKQAGLGCLVMSSPGPDRCGRVRAWSDPAQPAVPNHMMTIRRGVMPFCGLDCWLRPSVTLG